MPVHQLKSPQSFKQAIKDNQVVMIDFFAVWCGPCKAIAPVVAKYSDSETYKDIYFTKIDVDELSDLADELDIQAMPTFLLFKDGKEIDRQLEPSPKALSLMLDKGL